MSSLEQFFVCHCSLVPNNKFALLQHFTHPRCFGNFSGGSFCRVHIQRQFQSGMSSSFKNQQRCGYSGRSKGQRYVLLDGIDDVNWKFLVYFWFFQFFLFLVSFKFFFSCFSVSFFFSSFFFFFFYEFFIFFSFSLLIFSIFSSLFFFSFFSFSPNLGF